MKINITFTDEYLDEEVNKVLCYTKCDQLFLSNMIDIKYVDFFKEIMPKFSEIVYFEHDRPICPVCGREMDDNGSREVKPNKLQGIRKEQYICPECSKTKVTSLEPFISKFSTFSNDICEKGMNYDYISYMSYDSKKDMIKLENNVEISRQSIYYHTSVYSEAFLKRQEEINLELLKQAGIEPSGYYHYDEQFPFEGGKPLVRLSLIDALNNLVINDIIVDKKDFDKDLVESFLDSSLEGLPKDVLITDGASMYQKIIDKMGIKHQLCIFHVLKNHHESLFRSIRRLARRIRTIDNQQRQKKESIKKLDNELKQENLPAKKKTKKRNKIKQLNDEIRELRKERREKKAKLKELMNTNERVENIYKADDKKGANRRFNTLYNGRKFLNRHSGSYLENLGKKLDRTLTFYDDPLIPKTNNGIERYFGITLPSNLKRKFRTTGGLTRWLRLQKIKWTRRNVLHNYEVENLSLTDYLQEKII